MNLAFVLFLSADVNLDDVNAGLFVMVWSMSLTVMTMLVGAVADTFGIKRTLLMGTAILVFARFWMPLTTNIVALTILGFLPLGIGMAMKGPVLSVAIKKFTSKETAALGFGLFYTLMNVGWAAGAWVFDFIRIQLGEHSVFKVLDFSIMQHQMELSMSTYQVIFAVSFVCSIVNFFLISLMRDGVELDDRTGEIVMHPFPPLAEGNKLRALVALMKQAGTDSVILMKRVFTEKAFWVFIGMLSTLVFVRLVFYHFHYTFPKYGIRVLGEGLKIGSIFGVLNPVLIIFLTPLIAAMTKKIRSYNVLLVGTFVSASAIFIATMPEKVFEPLVGTWVGELIFVRWLEIPEGMRQPMIIGLVFMVIIFTIGEAIWSPRLMQFTAEIAPEGKEGAYIALSYLPYFAAKFFVGPMSGLLLATYVPENAESYPWHFMVWVWIGGMAIISPISLFVFRKAFARYARSA
jgi:MFS family permease